MPSRTARAWSALLALSATASLLTACSGGTQLKVSADTYCERYTYIPVAPEAEPLFVEHIAVLRPTVVAVASNNETYSRHCLQPAKGE